MGRIFEKRKDRMFARWSKMSKAFTKIGREIAIAVRLGGPSPATNSRLRMAMQNARSVNMPKDRVDSAILKASTKSDAIMDEAFYEAYGPGGVGIYIEAATDNPTRTIANIRMVINKYGGNMATSGALDFVFKRQGIFRIAMPTGDIDELELDLMDFGLEDMFETEEGDLLIYTTFSGFGEVQKYLESKGHELKSAGLQRTPLTYAETSEENIALVNKMISVLEDDDDVQSVYHNLQDHEE